LISLVIISISGVVGAMVGALVGGLIVGPPGMIIGGILGLQKGTIISTGIGAGVGVAGICAGRKQAISFLLSKNKTNDDDENDFKIHDIVKVIKTGRQAKIVGIYAKSNKKTVFDIEYSDGFFKSKTIYDSKEMESVQPGSRSRANTSRISIDDDKWTLSITRFFQKDM